MSQVSKNKLKADIYEKIFTLFPKLLIRLGNKSPLLIDTLFSQTEKTVLAKRLSIAFMLIKGYTYPTICDKLKVSLGTVAKVSEIIKRADTVFIKELKNIEYEEEFQQFLASLDYNLSKMLPPKGGNWSQWRKNLEQNHTNSKQPF